MSVSDNWYYIKQSDLEGKKQNKTKKQLVPTSFEIALYSLDLSYE